jgi:glycosyltransferase involved in cell wall biosynthesis
MKPLVSILIPAYNSEKWLAYTLQSAVAQTWERKEIIVVDDGSTDRTAEMARRFASKEVKVVSTANGGLSAAVNHAFQLCQGDYIQELDSDDLLSPDKIERQLAALREGDSKRILLSSPWAYFYYRTSHARFIPNSLWHDLSPVEWLLRKMGKNLHMQNATWLVSRELAEAAGPWDTRLHYDQDGEYCARVVMSSEGTRFVPEARVFYRSSDSNRVSYIGKSNTKKDSLFLSMKLHIQYLRSLEDSERVRKACLIYLQNWYGSFYPDRPDIAALLQSLAIELQGRLEPPRLRWKYEWMKPVFGWNAAKWAQRVLPETKSSLLRRWDKIMFKFETREASFAKPRTMGVDQED